MLAPEDDSRALDALRFSLASDIVELVVLTADDAFLQTLREASGSTRRLWHVLSADKVSDLLVAGGVGILVLDVQSLNEAPPRFIVEIKRQFPDLVVVVAGNRDAETELARLISDGSVYRFIHKPVSPARARLFAEAAVKRYEEQRRRAGAVETPARSSPRRPGPLLLGAGCAVGCVLLVSLWLARRSPREDTAPPSAAEIPVAAMPASPGTGTDVREQLLARAENALLEERLDEAAQAIEAARKAGVPSARIAFLSTQLSRARERAKVAAAQARLRAEVPGAARTAAATPIPPAVTTTPAEAQAGSAVAESPTGGAPADAAASTRQTAIPPAERSAALAMARIQEDRLIDPQDDSARFYVLEAQKQDRGSAAVEEAEQALALKLLDAAHAAIDRRDFTRASSWLDAAVGIAAPANIENLRRAQDSARALAAGEAADHLLKSAQERLAEDHLIEPEEDSAAYYLRTLRSVDPRNPALSGLTQEVGSRLIAKARSALTLQQYEAARSWLDQASTIGYSAPDAEAARQDLAAAQNRKPAETAVRNAAELDLMKSVPPTYPVAAEKSSTEGWVELDFTVTESGGVKDVTVHAAKPTGVFEQAATAALLQWQYRPVMQDSKPVAQRARIRIRFALSR